MPSVYYNNLKASIRYTLASRKEAFRWGEWGELVIIGIRAPCLFEPSGPFAAIDRIGAWLRPRNQTHFYELRPELVAYFYDSPGTVLELHIDPRYRVVSLPADSCSGIIIVQLSGCALLFR